MKRPKTGAALCKECFYWAFEEEIHRTIVDGGLFKRGEYVAIAASGGKDSTVLAHTMCLLNKRYDYGLKLVLLSIDEGISGYRDDSLETVKRNEIQYGIPLKILSYEDLYGWTMDRIVQQVGRKSNCTFCGVFRRQAMDRGAQMLGVDKMVTGHNADDIAETIVMNVLRGDVARLSRCSAIETGSEGFLPRSKPFKYTYEKEIVMYAYHKQLDYFCTECIYSPNAYRGHARKYIKDLEKIRPTAILDIIHSGECLAIRSSVCMPSQSTCQRCGHVSSQAVCKACVLLEGLNKGKPKLGIGKSNKVTARMQLNPDNLVDDTQNLTIGDKNLTNGDKLSSESLTNIEDIASVVDGEKKKGCSNESGVCCGGCSEGKKKQVKKFTLKDNPQAALNAAGVAKSMLDF